MGGQACVLYGAAEFSRDTDIVVVADADNLRRLQAAVNDLKAESIAVPPFERRFLEAGHAVHFRCRLPEADRRYWAPLKRELEQLRRYRGRND